MLPSEPAYGRLARAQGVHCSFSDHPPSSLPLAPRYGRKITAAIKTAQLPSGRQWLHEIKHDGFRIIARKKGPQVRLYSRPGNDFTAASR
jgi:ATP-dependent DNA ligase